jgi:hypothetical protein
MSPEWLTAVGTLGTFVVIAASAIAALMQLRHMRRGNQIAALDELRITMESADFRKALDFVRNELPDRLKGATIAAELRERGLRGDLESARFVANVFEDMGLFVRTGLIDKDTTCELYSMIASFSWDNICPITTLMRQESPAVWINFEYMAAISKDFIASDAGSEYPAGARRLPLDESLLRD